jgi:hypothetical protein
MIQHLVSHKGIGIGKNFHQRFAKTTYCMVRAIARKFCWFVDVGNLTTTLV